MSGMRALFTKLVEQKKQELDPAHIEKVRLVKSAVDIIKRDGDFHASILITGDGQYNGSFIELRTSSGLISETVMLPNDEITNQGPAEIAEMIIDKAAEQSAKAHRSHRYLDAARLGR